MNCRTSGEFPFATLKAKKGTIEATMEVFSSLIPGNLDESSMPALGISVRVKGSKSSRYAVSVSNITGTNLIGRVNESVEGGVRFVNRQCNDYDGAKGELPHRGDSVAENRAVQPQRAAGRGGIPEGVEVHL